VTRAEPGRGTVKACRNRQGVGLGYRAWLPRDLSRPPKECKNRKSYQEPLQGTFSTESEARGVLDAAIQMLRSNPLARDGLTLVDIAPLVIEAKERAALKVYGSKSRAHKRYATERGILQNWLKDAPFAMWPAHAVESIQVQQWADWLLDEAEGSSGEPLSPSFVRQMIGFLKTVFARALPNQPNVVDLVKLPPKQAPQNIPYLGIDAQRRFFRSAAVELADRTMVGCGMGAGLRIGELLATEIEDVHLDSEDPYLTVKYGGAGHVPTKGRRPRRVELFEPALGFWQIWIRQFYRTGSLVFAGPRGGYQKKWAEKFPAWAEVAGVDRLSSHIMRHSFAAAVLSGTWGYEPKSFEFVGRQLGHADTQITERYYGAFAPGVWLNEVRRMTGRIEYSRRKPVTARELLGLTDDAKDGESIRPTNSISGAGLDLVESSIESALPILAAKIPSFATTPSLTPTNRPIPPGMGRFFGAHQFSSETKVRSVWLQEPTIQLHAGIMRLCFAHLISSNLGVQVDAADLEKTT